MSRYIQVRFSFEFENSKVTYTEDVHYDTVENSKSFKENTWEISVEVSFLCKGHRSHCARGLLPPPYMEPIHVSLSLSLSLSLCVCMCVCVCVSLCLSLYRLQTKLRYIPFFKRISPACMLARAGACLGNHLMANLMRT
jgi:hypothetical protein